MHRQTGRNEIGVARLQGNGLVQTGAQIQSGGTRRGIGGQFVRHFRIEDFQFDFGLHGFSFVSIKKRIITAALEAV